MDRGYGQKKRGRSLASGPLYIVAKGPEPLIQDPGPAPLLFRLSPVFPAQRSALIPICQFVSTVPADAYNCFL